MTRKFTKEEMKLRRAGQLRAVLQLERAAAQWASEDPEYAAQRAKEARELRKDISLLEINNQFDLYKRLAATHGVEEEAEFQRRRHKGEFAGHRSGSGFERGGLLAKMKREK